MLVESVGRVIKQLAINVAKSSINVVISFVSVC